MDPVSLALSAGKVVLIVVVLRLLLAELKRIYVSTFVRRIVLSLGLISLALYIGVDLAHWPVVLGIPILVFLILLPLPDSVLAKIFRASKRQALFDAWVNLQRSILGADRDATLLSDIDARARHLDAFRSQATSRFIDLAQQEAKDWTERGRQPRENASRNDATRREAERLFGKTHG